MHCLPSYIYCDCLVSCWFVLCAPVEATGRKELTNNYFNILVKFQLTTFNYNIILYCSISCVMLIWYIKSILLQCTLPFALSMRSSPSLLATFKNSLNTTVLISIVLPCITSPTSSSLTWQFGRNSVTIFDFLKADLKCSSLHY